MKNKNLRTISETGGGVLDYARETTTTVEESIEADTEPAAAAMPAIRMIDLTRQHVSRQQKAMWTFISDGARPGEMIYFVGMGVYVVTSA